MISNIKYFYVPLQILHALGFYHEQEWPDRDTHVRILWDNIEPGSTFVVKLASFRSTCLMLAEVYFVKALDLL